MGKRLFLLGVLGLIGVAAWPGASTADSMVALAAPEFHAVETVPLPEVEEIEEAAYLVSAPAAGYAPAEAAPQMINYAVTAYSGAVVETPSYADIYKTGNLVYGHNTANLLGNLGVLGVGSVFTVTEGGAAQIYQVARVLVFEKDQATGRLQENGRGDFMPTVAQAAYKGEHYALALMTCTGTPIADKPGDATHRLVVFANRV